MPVTITLPQPFGVVGPGCNIGLQSDFIGPLPGGSSWDVEILTGDAFEDQYIRETRFTQSNPFSLFLLSSGQAAVATTNGQQPAPSTDVRVVARLMQGGTVLDQGSIDAHWDPTVGLGLQTALRGSASGQSGFTGQDRALLVSTEARTQLLGEPGTLLLQTTSGPIPTTLSEIFSRNLLDTLTLDELTSGPTCDPVRAIVKLWFFGIIVRVTTIADDLVPKTPDFEWYFPDLAVLRLIRGSDLYYRRGIHTPTFMMKNDYEFRWQILAVDAVLGAAPDVTVAVDWRAGCCGQVFVQRFP